MPGFLSIKNWSDFQHYKDRNPPWIKLHRSLLDDYEFTQLPDADKAHLLLLWLYASHHEGRVPADPDFLSRKIGAAQPVNLKLLIERGFLVAEHESSNVLAVCKQPDSELLPSRAPAYSRETETETEKPLRGEPRVSDLSFQRFWQAYPKKRNRGTAEKAFAKVKPDEALLARILQAVEVAKRRDDWRKDNGQFVPYAASWLNAKGWEDEPDAPIAGPQRKAVMV